MLWTRNNLPSILDSITVGNVASKIRCTLQRLQNRSWTCWFAPGFFCSFRDNSLDISRYVWVWNKNIFEALRLRFLEEFFLGGCPFPLVMRREAFERNTPHEIVQIRSDDLHFKSSFYHFFVYTYILFPEFRIFRATCHTTFFRLQTGILSLRSSLWYRTESCSPCEADGRLGWRPFFHVLKRCGWIMAQAICLYNVYTYLRLY